MEKFTWTMTTEDPKKREPGLRDITKILNPPKDHIINTLGRYALTSTIALDEVQDLKYKSEVMNHFFNVIRKISVEGLMPDKPKELWNEKISRFDVIRELMAWFTVHPMGVKEIDEKVEEIKGHLSLAS